MESEQQPSIFRAEAVSSQARLKDKIPLPNLQDNWFFFLSWALFFTIFFILVLLISIQKLPATTPGVAHFVGNKAGCTNIENINVIILINNPKYNFEPGSRVILIREGVPPIHTTLIKPSSEFTECMNNSPLTQIYSSNGDIIAYTKIDKISDGNLDYKCYIEVKSKYIYQWIIESLL